MTANARERGREEREHDGRFVKMLRESERFNVAVCKRCREIRCVVSYCDHTAVDPGGKTLSDLIESGRDRLCELRRDLVDPVGRSRSKYPSSSRVVNR